jgi:site-specific DNA recombinase
MTAPIVRVALYTRISTDETNQPYSLGAQRDRLEAYITSQPGWTIVERYTDQASARNLDRPGLTAARAGAAAGRFDLLLVYRVDRLSRNLGDLITIGEELQRTGVGLRSATESFDTADPAGRMLFQLLGSFAEFERTTMHDRINSGLERKASRAEWTGGAPPFGYRKERDESFLRPDPATAPIVRSIFTRYVQTRDGARAIAAWLDAQGIRTRNGTQWGTSGVLALLRRRTYIGEVSFRGQWRASPHEPLLERELFDAAQAILDQRAASPAVRRSNPADYLFSTLSIVCDRCGHPMVGASAHGRGGKSYTYYTCSTRARRGPSGCDQERLPKDELEEAILAQMTEVYADTSLVAAALEEAQAESRARDTERSAERHRLEAHATELRRKIDRYVAGFEAGELRASFLQSRTEVLQAQLETVETALAQEPALEPPSGHIDVALVSWGLSQALGEVLASTSPRLTKELLRVLIKEIRVVSPLDIRPTYRVPAAEVRIMEDLVELQGLEPWTSCMPCRRSSS